MSKLQLPNVTAVVIDCCNYGDAINALQKSMELVEFGAVKFLTDINILLDGIEVVEIPRINSKEEYSRFVIQELYQYFGTSHVLVMQHDGYVLDAAAWKDEFLEYDYIGAPWLYVDGRNVGNGGFSLRSKKLQESIAYKEYPKGSPEDEYIGRLMRPTLEHHDKCKFAPEELADAFAFELRQPNQPTFGFHGKFHQPYKPYVLIKRSGALGDCVLMEPVLAHFHEQGYNVVLDIPAHYFDLFLQHDYPVYHKSQIDWGRITPEKKINLDMAYEVRPYQTYLKSYFETAGIQNPVLRKPKLYPQVDERTKAFKKYCVIHIDKRDQDERNVQISQSDWQDIALELAFKGYTAIQIGISEHERVAIEYNTSTIAHAKWLIAGADLFIGVDSGMSHIAVASGVPSVIFFGSVDPERIHCDLTKIEPIQAPCDKKHCWHFTGSTAGKQCAHIGTEKAYQCTKISGQKVIDAINRLVV